MPGNGSQWTARGFERLLGELHFELRIGDAAQIRSKRVRKQKTDRQDAQLLLRLLIENRFPCIWAPNWENRDLRQLLWHRHRMVQMRPRVMNQLHVVALNEGIRRKKELWRPAGRLQLHKPGFQRLRGAQVEDSGPRTCAEAVSQPLNREAPKERCFTWRLAQKLQRPYSFRKMLRRELWTRISPLYSMNPSFLKRFIKKLTRDRVVPIISARISWLTLGITVSGLLSLPNWASSNRILASRFSLELKS